MRRILNIFHHQHQVRRNIQFIPCRAGAQCQALTVICLSLLLLLLLLCAEEDNLMMEIFLFSMRVMYINMKFSFFKLSTRSFSSFNNITWNEAWISLKVTLRNSCKWTKSKCEKWNKIGWFLVKIMSTFVPGGGGVMWKAWENWRA